MVLLNPNGFLYLKEIWILNVNKNGEARKINKTIKETEKLFLATKQQDMQRLDNMIMNFLSEIIRKIR
jgi:hypothetical protein